MMDEKPIYFFHPLLSFTDKINFFGVMLLIICLILQIILMLQKIKFKEYLSINAIIFITLSYFGYHDYQLELANRPLLEFYKDGMCYYNNNYENYYYAWHKISDLKLHEYKGGRSIIFKMQDEKYKYMKNYSLSTNWNKSNLKLIVLMQDYIAKAKENPPAPDAPERRCTTLPEKP